MKTTLVVPDTVAAEFQTALNDSRETAGVLVARVVETPSGSVRILGTQMHWVRDESYLKRTPTSLGIASEGYVLALGEAERAGALCMWVHTHPGSLRPSPSFADEAVDAELAGLFRLRTNSPYYGALILSRINGALGFSGTISKTDHSPNEIDNMWIVGDRLTMVRNYHRSSKPPLSQFDRNVRAFGPAIQQALENLTIGIVGCGGTGSSVAEQLSRLGVRRFVLFDPDTLSSSNVTRVYGSTPSDVGEYKVDVLSSHLSKINPDISCVRIRGSILAEESAIQLTECDLIFGCTDDNAGRLILSRFASYLITPVIDCGVLISSDGNNQMMGIDGRVTVLVPGQACLVCRNRIDLKLAASEQLVPFERAKLEREGYAPALGRTEPAVVAFTTIVGASAVTELLERMIGFGPTPRPSETLIRIHEREISTNIVHPNSGHYCDPTKGRLGAGITKPFLDITWQK